MIIIICGVAGSGKTTIGQMLSERTGWDFIDADDYHLESSKEKMALGIPLTDEDREQWLHELNLILLNYDSNGKNVILACSALTRKIRDILLSKIRCIYMVWLEGSFDILKKRIESRSEHFFPSSLLKSQYDLAEKPTEARAFVVQTKSEEIVDSILSEID